MTRYPNENTAQFIRRRVTNWKTTLAGLGTILCPIAIAIWPEHATHIAGIQSALTGMGLIAAADAKQKPSIIQ